MEHLKELDQAECVRAGVICATIANSSGRYKKKFSHKDFFKIQKKSEIKEQSTKEQIGTVKMVYQMMGGK